jgi:hypothetical protein
MTININTARQNKVFILRLLLELLDPPFSNMVVSRFRCLPCTHELTDLATQLGRLTHYAFDAILISAFLAGVKRSTGLT